MSQQEPAENQPPTTRNVYSIPPEQSGAPPEPHRSDQTYNTPQINTDSQEPVPAQIPPYKEYQGASKETDPSTISEQLLATAHESVSQPHYQKRFRFWLGLIILCIILFTLGQSYTAGVGNVGSPPVKEARTFIVIGKPKLVLTAGSGTVRIHPANNNSSIQIRAVKQAYGVGTDSKKVKVNYQQDGDVITVDATHGNNFFTDTSVDFDILAPISTDLDVHTGAGSVELSGIQGQLILGTGNGSIDASDIGGMLKLTTGNGAINVNGIDQVNGQLDVETGNGPIDVSQAKLSGKVLFRTGSGSINFDGSIEPQGTYHFESANGSVDLTFPASSAFRLTAVTGSGSLDNEFGSDSVGNGQQADIMVHAGNNSINIHKAS